MKSEWGKKKGRPPCSPCREGWFWTCLRPSPEVGGKVSSASGCSRGLSKRWWLLLTI